MDYGHRHCSEVGDAPRASSDDEVILASSCPKKKAGRKKFKETRHPVFRGVRQRNGSWVCEVRTPNNKSRIWLGTYPTPEMAARAHDVAALALRGRTACLNFADSAWRLPIPASTDNRDIQRAAAEAAEAFRPPEPEMTEESSCMRGGNYDEVSTGENQVESSEGVLPENSATYMDEEAVFDMPRLLDNMAEGLLLPPPHSHDYVGGFSCEDTEVDCEVSLWSYSI